MKSNNNHSTLLRIFQDWVDGTPNCLRIPSLMDFQTIAHTHSIHNGEELLLKFEYKLLPRKRFRIRITSPKFWITVDFLNIHEAWYANRARGRMNSTEIRELVFKSFTDLNLIDSIPEPFEIIQSTTPLSILFDSQDMRNTLKV